MAAELDLSPIDLIVGVDLVRLIGSLLSGGGLVSAGFAGWF